MRQLVYTMFVSNKRTSFHSRWKENLIKHQKVSKYYENDCLLAEKECRYCHEAGSYYLNGNITGGSKNFAPSKLEIFAANNLWPPYDSDTTNDFMLDVRVFEFQPSWIFRGLIWFDMFIYLMSVYRDLSDQSCSTNQNRLLK